MDEIITDADTDTAHDVILRWATTAAMGLVPVAFLIGGLAPMAAREHPGTVAVVTAGWWASWTVTPLLVVAYHLLGRHLRTAPVAPWAGWAATVPPVVTILLGLGL
ncbi:hypothetical protein [Streptomyces sp. NPDC047014]|uniref:hypothetical protein n=1 Tax=Streptomyces sp. NPDC047014 TaxID=3155736 RepID=UPI0033F29F91